MSLAILETAVRNIDEIVSSLDHIVSSLDLTEVACDDAARLVQLFIKGERLCHAGKSLSARRAAEGHIHSNAGHKDPSSWLAEKAGEPLRQARAELDAAARLARLDETGRAFRSGELSAPQVETIAEAATADPTSEKELLELARKGSLRELREECERVKAAARSAEEAEERYARIRKERCLRIWSGSDGATKGQFSLTPDAGAKLLAGLQPWADRFFDEARKAGHHESNDAYMADALVASVTGIAGPPAVPPAGPGYRAAGPAVPPAGPAYRAAGPAVPPASPGYRAAGPAVPPAGPGYRAAGPASPHESPTGQGSLPGLTVPPTERHAPSTHPAPRLPGLTVPPTERHAPSTHPAPRLPGLTIPPTERHAPSTRQGPLSGLAGTPGAPPAASEPLNRSDQHSSRIDEAAPQAHEVHFKLTGGDTGASNPSSPPPARRPPPPPPATVICRVDLAALLRGSVVPGEMCEIPGVGPVPVSTAREMLTDCFLKLVITDGVDVRTVVHYGRTLTAHQRTALEFRDPYCVVPGCGRSFGLENDHIKEFALGGPTSLDNLCRLCQQHHALKTHHGYKIRGRPGAWEWIASNRPAGASGVPPQRRLRQPASTGRR